MKSICFFISYTNSDHKQDLPMINDIVNHFDKVVVISNKTFSFTGVDTLIMKNLGYDFGFFYRGLQEINLSEYSEITFINNSNVLLKNRSLGKFFEWVRATDSNFLGITDSHEAPRGIDKNKSYHIQSHLLVFKKSAIQKLNKFFKDINFESFFTVTNKSELRKRIINQCEIGLTQFMINANEKPTSWFKSKEFNPKYKRPINSNMHVYLWEELIKNGYPLMKKKIITGEWAPLLPNIKNKHKYLI